MRKWNYREGQWFAYVVSRSWIWTKGSRSYWAKVPHEMSFRSSGVWRELRHIGSISHGSRCSTVESGSQVRWPQRFLPLFTLCVSLNYRQIYLARFISTEASWPHTRWCLATVAQFLTQPSIFMDLKLCCFSVCISLDLPAVRTLCREERLLVKLSLPNSVWFLSPAFQGHS